MLQTEAARRNGIKSHDRRIEKSIRNKIKGINLSSKSQNDLFHKEWDILYPCDDSNDKRFYVYAHVKPTVGCIQVKTNESDWTGIRINGIPFYIGKGCGDRAYDLNRNQGHGQEIKNLLKSGEKKEKIVCILADGLTEIEALKIESKLIYFFGTRYDENGMGILVNLDKPIYPKNLDYRNVKGDTKFKER